MTMNSDMPDLAACFPGGGRVLCAVSGGADSMCLLHLLWQRQEALGLEVLAAHYEHGLRGEESLRDAAFVESFCARRGIPCVTEHGDAAGFAASMGMGIEEAARTLRYDFLQRSAEALDCRWIATAHNADDNAETLLLNLCRGAGTAGLRGIPERRGNIVRPLLSLTRQQIEDYLVREGLPHVEDSSNADDLYRRNRLRHSVLPVLRELNPAFSRSALRTSKLLERDEDCLSAQAADFIRAHFDGESLELRALRELHPAISSRVFRQLCPRALSLEHVESLLALCRGEGPAFCDVPGLRVRREQGRLYFAPEAEAPSIPDRELVPGQWLEAPELGLRLYAEEIVCGGEINDLFKTYLFKSENICGKIAFTGRKSGDRIRPAGRGCSKSLKALFAEAGMSLAQRGRTPVFRDERGLLAVYGLAVAERAVPAQGDACVRVRIETM